MGAPKLNPRPLQSHRVEQWQGGHSRTVDDLVADETPLQLRYNRRPFAVVMVTPDDVQDFALGFTLSEGICTDRSEIQNLRIIHHSESIEVWLRIPTHRAAVLRQRLLPGRSGCGLCGSPELDDALQAPPAVAAVTRIQPWALQAALRGLDGAQELKALTGAAHAAVWCGPDGTTQLAREDVGRHNALDKLIGALGGSPPKGSGFALITSRASYEMVQKAAFVGIEMLAAVSAPTGLAVRLAHDCGMTLVGFARPGRHVVYTHPWRLTGGTRP